METETGSRIGPSTTGRATIRGWGWSAERTDVPEKEMKICPADHEDSPIGRELCEREKKKNANNAG